MIRRRKRPRYPLPPKKKRRRRVIGFDEFAGIYMRRWSKVRKATWDDDRNALRKYLLPAFGFTPLSEIGRTSVWQLLDTVAARHPGAANRLKSLLSCMFRLACDWGYLPDNYPNPTLRIPSYPEGERDRFLSDEEHARLEAALDEEQCLYVRSFFRLLLRTTLRKGELLRLHWADIDLKAGEVRLYKTKNKSRRTLYLPLSSSAAQILQELPRCENNPHVFPGYDHRARQWSADKGRATFDHAWRKIRNKAGLHDVWIHDLRRTAASYMAQSGESLYLIGRTLNHSSPGTTMRYARFQKGNIKEALDRLAKRLDKPFLDERSA